MIGGKKRILVVDDEPSITRLLKLNLEQAGEYEVATEDALVLQVHDALARLEAEDAVKAEVVKLRFFVGLGNSEIAAILGVSEKTVQRHWAFAKAWLFRAMQQK
jgi:RNA polymerase sigma factor (sigma-70 family)